MKWNLKIKFAEQALQAGDLDRAIRYCQSGQIRNRNRKLTLVRQLADALLERSQAAISMRRFGVAWEDLDAIANFDVKEFRNELRARKNQLIELTIESADASLVRGEPVCALNCIEFLGQRRVMDWRLNNIKTVSECLNSASRFAAKGQFKKSVAELEKAKTVRPDLPFLADRILAFKTRARQMKKYVTNAKAHALQGKWGDVSLSCEQILHIAPTNQVAFEARRECRARLKKKTRRQMNSTTVNSSKVQCNPAINMNPDTKNVVVEQSLLDRIRPMDYPASGNKFLLWVDGVGGYFVCGNRINSLGQAIDGAKVDIGIQGNLRSHHANFERVEGGHLLEPIGNVSIDGVELDSKVVLKNGQKLSFEGGVELAYCQTHALSKTALLNFVSRHRSVPWADAVILPVTSIILGPNRLNHVYCPTWSESLVLFERAGQWFCRAKQELEVDGKLVMTETAIGMDSRIAGDDFSLTLEPV